MIYFEDNFPEWNSGVNFKKTVTFASGYTNNGVLPPNNIYIDTGVLAAASFAQNTSYPYFTIPNDGPSWKVVNFSYRFTAQSTAAATFSLEVASAGTAPGSGTAQTGALSLQGTANTTINATITTQTTLSAGTSLNLVVSNTASTSGLVGLQGTVVLQRVS